MEVQSVLETNLLFEKCVVQMAWRGAVADVKMTEINEKNVHYSDTK